MTWLNVALGPCPLVEGLAPPLLMLMSLVFLFPLTKLLLGVIVVVFESMTTFWVTIPPMMET